MHIGLGSRVQGLGVRVKVEVFRFYRVSDLLCSGQ